MFILIVVIILGTTISVLGSIYYNTISLQRSYGTVNSYYGAYYGAVSSVERGLLMTKLKYPGYVGNGGFEGENAIGAISNAFSGTFRKLNQGASSMTWSVDGQSKKIVGTVDTDTVKSISFRKYADSDTGGFTSEITETAPYGVHDGLTFSGTITPTRKTQANQNVERDDVDFNREFILTDSGYKLRSLKRLTGEIDNEKDFELSGNFSFKTGTCNPRAAQSGTFITGYDGCSY